MPGPPLPWTDCCCAHCGFERTARFDGGGRAEADPAAAAHLDSETLAYLPPKNYPTGVVTLPANFDKPGKYAVLVTVSDGKDMTMSGKLTVTVGQETRRWVLVFALAGIILVVGFGIYIWDFNSRKKLPAKSG